MKSRILTLIALAFLIISCKQEPKNDNTTTVINESIGPEAFADKLNSTENPQLVDVRTPEEYNSKHLENAINIDYNGADFVEKINKLDKTKPVFVYCLSGGRSGSAADKMSELGFQEVYNMKGGMMKWNALGISDVKVSSGGMTKADFDKLLDTDKKVLVDFYAEWCGPCKQMEPFLNKMTDELKDKVTIIRIDVDKNEVLANELKIEALPTLILYENKKQTWQSIGFMPEDELRKKL